MNAPSAEVGNTEIRESTKTRMHWWSSSYREQKGCKPTESYPAYRRNPGENQYSKVRRTGAFVRSGGEEFVHLLQIKLQILPSRRKLQEI